MTGAATDPRRAALLAVAEAALDEILPAAGWRPRELGEAMRYAVGSGGKRIRPLVCLASAEAAGGSAEDAKYPAAAIELLHNYTLVHDDLPSMDGDETRRGRPSVWKKYGEACAVLVGDALQALAFDAAARAPRNAAAVVAALAASGVGVVRGQVEDVAAAAGGGLAKGDVPFVYERKTADLFVAAAAMGALAGGGDAAAVARLSEFARNLGLAFQHQDDALDGDSPYGTEGALALAEECTAAALAALDGLPGDASFLAALAKSLSGRRV